MPAHSRVVLPTMTVSVSVSIDGHRASSSSTSSGHTGVKRRGDHKPQPLGRGMDNGGVTTGHEDDEEKKEPEIATTMKEKKRQRRSTESGGKARREDFPTINLRSIIKMLTKDPKWGRTSNCGSSCFHSYSSLGTLSGEYNLLTRWAGITSTSGLAPRSCALNSQRRGHHRHKDETRDESRGKKCKVSESRNLQTTRSNNGLPHPQQKQNSPKPYFPDRARAGCIAARLCMALCLCLES